MADSKVSALPPLTGANTAANDLLLITDMSVLTSKSITRDEMKVALLSAPTAIGSTTPNTANFTTIVLPKAAGQGMKVDHADPTFGWRDIIGLVAPKVSGGGSPNRTAYIGNIADFSFAQNDLCDFTFHIPHDYVPGTDLFFHIHWSHNGTAVSGNAVFTFYTSYAKRTLAGTTPFSAQTTNAITWNTVDIATTPRYGHRVDEIAITSSGGTANLIDNALIEPDGIVLMTLALTTRPSITGGNLFVHTCDIHYQSNNAGTKSSAPDYYV